MQIIRAEDSLQLLDYCLSDLSKFRNDNPLSPAFVIVPETLKSDLERRYLERYTDEALLPAEILSFSRFAVRIFNISGRLERKPLTKAAKIIVFRHLLRQHASELQEFRRVGHKRGFAAEIVQRLGLFERNQLTTETLAEVVEQATDHKLQGKLADLLFLNQAYHDWLAHSDYYEPECDLAALTELLNNPQPLQQPAIDFLANSHIWICGFAGERNFTGDEYRLITALAQRCARLSVTVSAPTADTKEVAAETLIYAHGHKSLQGLAERLPVDIKDLPATNNSPIRRHLRRLVSTGQADFNTANSDDNDSEQDLRVTVTRTVDSYLQAGYVAGVIKQLLHDRPGLRRRDIAIAVTTEEDLPLLQVVLNELDLAAFVAMPAHQKESLFYRFLAAWLRLAEGNRQTTLIVELLRSGLFSLSPLTIDLLENYWLARGIKYYGRQALHNLDLPVTDKIELQAIIDQQIALADRLKQAKSLQEKSETLLQVMQESQWQSLLAAKCDALIGKGTAQRAADRSEMPSVAQRAAHGIEAASEVSRPLPQAKLLNNQHSAALIVAGWNKLIELLQDLPSLMPAQELAARDFSELLLEALADLKTKTIPLGIDRIRVDKIANLVNYPCRVLLVVGARASALPTPAPASGMFNSREIEQINQLSGKDLPQVHRQHATAQNWLLSQLLTRPTEDLYLCCDSVDSEETANLINKLVQLKRRSPSLAFLHTELIISPLTTSPLWCHRRLVERYLRSPASASDVLDMPRPQIQLSTDLSSAHSMSVSAIQRYNSCPYAYFAERLLRLQERKIYRPENYERGNIAHTVLQLMFAELKRRVAQVQNSNGGKNLSASEREALLAQWYAEMQSESGINRYYRQALQSAEEVKLQKQLRLTPELAITDLSTEGLLPFRDAVVDAHLGRRIRDAVYATLLVNRQWLADKDNQPLPRQLEQKLTQKIRVNLPPELQGTTVDTAVALTLQGIIDRVDSAEAGSYIIDYKTGNRSIDIAKISEGLDLQLAVYKYLWEQYSESPVNSLTYFQVRDLPLGDERRAGGVKQAKKQHISELTEMQIMAEAQDNGETYTYELGEAAIYRLALSCQDLQRGDFSPLPRISKQEAQDWEHSPCRYCQLQNLCRMDSSADKCRRLTPARDLSDFLQPTTEVEL